jgi:hypothetical protein
VLLAAKVNLWNMKFYEGSYLFLGPKKEAGINGGIYY